METTIDKISAKINNSTLTQEDKSTLLEAFKIGDEESLVAVLNLITGDSNWINILSENLKEKQKMFQTGDKKMLDEILKKEDSHLDSLS